MPSSSTVHRWRRRLTSNLNQESQTDERRLPFWLQLAETAFRSFHPVQLTCASRWAWNKKSHDPEAGAQLDRCFWLKSCSTPAENTFHKVKIHTWAGEPFDNSTNSKKASWGSRMSDPGRTTHGSPACSLRWRAWWRNGSDAAGLNLHMVWKVAAHQCFLTCRPGWLPKCSSFPCTRGPWGSRHRDSEGSVWGPAGSRGLLSRAESASCSNYL